MDESSSSSDAFKELCTVMDLALHATMAHAQVINKNIGNLLVLEHHLWLNLMEQRTKLPSLTYLSIPRNFLALPWMDSLSASQRHRSHCKPSITSCQSAPAQWLIQVARRIHPLRSLRSLCSFCPILRLSLSLVFSSTLRQPNDTCFPSSRDPALEWHWTLSCRSYPDPRESKTKRQGPYEAKLPSKKSHVCSPPPPTHPSNSHIFGMKIFTDCQNCWDSDANSWCLCVCLNDACAQTTIEPEDYCNQK